MKVRFASGPWPLVLAAALAAAAAGCSGGGGGEEDVQTEGDLPAEIPDQFTFFIELVPAVGYEAGRDVSSLTVTIHTDPPILIESVDVPTAGPYLFSFDMDPAQSMITAAVTADGYRSELEGTIFSTGRCPPVRLGDYGLDPVTSEPRPLKLFFHRLEEFSLMPPGASMAFGRVGHRAAVASDGRIVVAGGATLEGLTRVVEIFDIAAMAFTTAAVELPAVRSEFALVETEPDRWFLIGGRTAQTEALTMQVQAGALSFAPVAIPSEIQGVWANPRAALLGDGSVVLGGADTGPDAASSHMAVLDAAGTVSMLALSAGGDPVELDKYHPTLSPVQTATGEQVLIYGGGGMYIPALLLDPLTGELTDGGQENVDGRYDHQAAGVTMHSDDGAMENQAVIIMAGEQKIDETTVEPASGIYVFIPACLDGPCIMGSAWSNGGPAFADRPAKSGAAAALEGNRVLHMGGRGPDGEAVDSVVVITALTPTQFYAGNLRLAVARVAPEVVFNPVTQQLFIIGGEGEGGLPLDSVEVFTPRVETP
jgi:hypothetical protein